MMVAICSFIFSPLTGGRLYSEISESCFCKPESTGCTLLAAGRCGWSSQCPWLVLLVEFARPLIALSAFAFVVLKLVEDATLACPITGDHSDQADDDVFHYFCPPERVSVRSRRTAIGAKAINASQQCWSVTISGTCISIRF